MKQKNSNKLAAPVIITIIFILLLLAYIGLFIWIEITSPTIWWLTVIYIITLAAMIAGIIIALRERIKEIKGGEEDEASKY